MNELTWRDLSIKYAKPPTKAMRETLSPENRKKMELRRKIERIKDERALEKELGL